MADSCIVDPSRDCIGRQRADEVARDVRALDVRFTEFQNRTADTHSRFGGRIGELEAHNKVQDELLRQIKETQSEIKREISDSQKDQKEQIGELRKEHKESMKDLKDNVKEILNAVTPLKQKVDSLEHLKKDVEEIKSKPGKTWEFIKEKGLGWILLVIFGLIAFALGLNQYL